MMVVLMRMVVVVANSARGLLGLVWNSADA